VQFLADPGAKHRYRRTAHSQVRSLSQWLRTVADAAASQDPERHQLRSRAGLEAFFRKCNEVEQALSDGPAGRPEQP